MNAAFLKLAVAGALLLAPLAPAVASASPAPARADQWGAAFDRSAPAVERPATSNGISLCNGAFFGGTFEGTVVVPPNVFCLLGGVTVTGNVVVQAGAGFIAVGVTIDGSLASSGASFIAIGNAAEEGGPDLASTIDRSVTINGTTGTPGFPTSNVICDATTVGGSVVVSSNKAPFSIGTDPDCFFPGTTPAGDTIGGSVAIDQNRGVDTVFDNQIDFNLACSTNKPSPQGGGNTVLGVETGQCTGF